MGPPPPSQLWILFVPRQGFLDKRLMLGRTTNDLRAYLEKAVGTRHLPRIFLKHKASEPANGPEE